MPQRRLFPLQIEFEYPYNPTSAVLKRKIRAEDGLTYAIKGKNAANDYTPVNEWICSSIATQIGVPTPSFKLITDRAGVLYFGSQWGAGLKSHVQYFQNVEDPSMYWAILVFDLFMLNSDRHCGNYIVQEIDGNDKLIAFDHSHTLLYHYPLPSPEKIVPIRMDCFAPIMRHFNMRPDRRRTNDIIRKFNSLDAPFFDTIVRDCRHWMSDDVAEALLQWLKERSSCTNNINDFIGRL